MLLSLLPLAYAAVQLAEPEVTMGGERAQPELVGPGEGLPVVRLGRLLIRRVGVRGDLAKKAQNPGLESHRPGVPRRGPNVAQGPGAAPGSKS